MNATLELIRTTLRYVENLRGQSVLIKLGGSALQNDSVMHSLCEDLLSLHGSGIECTVVHGGGPAINQELTLRNIEWTFINGLRVTTPEMMAVIEMTLYGQVNAKLLRKMNELGLPAVGLTGASAQILYCSQADPALQQVGVIRSVNPAPLQKLLPQFVPVVAPLGIGEHGESYNINADWAAARIAEAMTIKKLIFITDQDGILDENGNLLSEVDVEQLESLITRKVVKDGMLAKVQTILHALNHGVSEVHILNGKRPHCLIEELFTNQGVGTICRINSFRSET